MENHHEHAPDDGVLFFEKHAAAQSLKSFWTRLASTYGCMRVVLSRKKLTIKPHRFVRWLINLLDLDLSHEIPITHIRGVIVIGKWLRYGKVELRFETPEGEDRRIWLYLKKYVEFIDKTSKAINQ
jgi:hypothetical protein